MNPSNPGAEYAGRIQSAAAPLVERVRDERGRALYGAPDAQAWSAIEILAHAAEFMPYWARQAATVAASDRPIAFGRTHDDVDRITAVTDHAADELETAIQRLEGALAETARIVRPIPAEGWSRRGRHSRRGEMTAAGIIDAFVLDHLREHSRQLDDVLASRAEPGAADPASA